MCINQITLLKSAVGNLLASVNIMKKDLEIYHVEIGFSMWFWMFEEFIGGASLVFPFTKNSL
jgi:hypothetical protein